MKKPELGFWQIWNMSFGFFGIQIAFGLQNANVSAIFQTLGADMGTLPVLWLAGPITGLLVQPLIGYFSDRTWGPLGRRRPYFLAGAILTSLALVVMPNSPMLWVAASTLWILDASINISMEPFRAFVGDMLPSSQRTRGYAMQGVFIGAGAVLASVAPYVLTNYFGVSNTAPAGEIALSVRLSFYIGAAALFAAILWTVLTTREYPPEQLAAFDPPENALAPSEMHSEREAANSQFVAAAMLLLATGAVGTYGVYARGGEVQLYILTGGLVFFGLLFALATIARQGFLGRILNDLLTMPRVMQRLAVVQFFTWFAFFIMWIYAVPAVTQFQYATTDTASQAYADGRDWIGILFGVYSGVAALYAFILPWVARRLGVRLTHALNLLAGAAGFASFFVVQSPMLLLVSMVGVGMAWASLLTIPYAILADALPPQKMGIYMGIFNFFIVIPQIVVAGIMGTLMNRFLDNTPINTFPIAGAVMAIAAVAMFAVPGAKARAA